MDTGLTIGVDLGTSGVRAALISRGETALARSSLPIPIEKRRDPDKLIFAVKSVLADLVADIREPISALAICGTSGSFVPLDQLGNPAGPIALYLDPAEQAAVASLATHADAASPVNGPNSPLAKIISCKCARIAFEADFVAGKLMGAEVPTDANNALKAGGDPIALAWPDWIETSGAYRTAFPKNCCSRDRARKDVKSSTK